MIPDPDLQLKVVIKALRDTVMPALDPAQSTAIEQLGLSIATLEMVRARSPYRAAREWIDLADAVELARCVSAVTGHAELTDEIATGQRLLEISCPPIDSLERSRGVILSTISALVETAADANIDRLTRIVIAGSKPSTDMARSWSRSAGFEPEPADVPELTAFLEQRIKGSA